MLIGRDHSSLQTDLAVPLHLQTPYFLPPSPSLFPSLHLKRKATAEADKEAEVAGRVGQTWGVEWEAGKEEGEGSKMCRLQQSRKTRGFARVVREVK